MASYRLRHSTYNGRDTYVLTHDGCPLPIVAFCNYLLLTTSGFKPAFSLKNDREVTLGEVVEMFKGLITNRVSQDKDKLVGKEKTAKTFQIMVVTRGVDTLQGKCGLQPSFGKSTRHFDTPDDPDQAGTIDQDYIFNLCRLLGTDLHHGFLADPQEAELYQALTTATPDDYQKDLISAFKATVGQLTSYGLDELIKNTEEEALAFLFRRDCLRIVYKHHGELFELETSNGNWNKLESKMWRTISLSGEDAFFKADFSPTDEQPNSHVERVRLFIAQWTQEENARKLESDAFLAALQLTSEDSLSLKGNTSKPRKKKAADRTLQERSEPDEKAGEVETLKNPPSGSTDSNEQIHDAEAAVKSTGGNASQTHSSGSNEQTCDSKADVKSTGSNASQTHSSGSKVDSDGFDWVRARFMDFFKGFIDHDDDFPSGVKNKAFYIRKLTEMLFIPKNQRSNRLVVDFSHIMEFNEILGIAILNDRTRLNHILTQVVIDVCVENGWDINRAKKLRLCIHNLPPAGSILHLENFLKSNNVKLSQLYEYYDGTRLVKDCTTTYVGRITVKGYVDYIIENHKENKSWNGDWKLIDMIVNNGKFEILKPAESVATRNSMYRDFMKLIDLLFHQYEIDGLSPTYFSIFQQDVMKLIDICDKDPKKFKVVQRYFSHGPAFKAPLVLSTLLHEMVKNIQAQRIRNPVTKTLQAFDKLREPTVDWRPTAKATWGFKDVYLYDNALEGRYADVSHFTFSEYLRNVDEHLTDHTRDENGKQLINDPVHIILMLGKAFAKEISGLVYHMMTDLTDAPYSSAWRHYEKSECGDVPDNASSGIGMAKVLQSAGVSSASGSGHEDNPRPDDQQNARRSEIAGADDVPVAGGSSVSGSGHKDILRSDGNAAAGIGVAKSPAGVSSAFGSGHEDNLRPDDQQNARRSEIAGADDVPAAVQGLDPGSEDAVSL